MDTSDATANERDLRILLADIENEAIDKSQWRPKTEPIVNEFRARQPDIVIQKDCPDCKGAGATGGRRCTGCHGSKRVTEPRRQDDAPMSDIQYAQAQVRSVMRYLRETRDEDRAFWLTEQNVHDGDTFEIWQMWFTAELSCRPNTIYSPEMRGIRRSLAEDDLAHDDYGKLCRGLSRRQLALIETAIKTPATEHQAWLASRDAAHYREAFERLSTVMERLRAEFKARRDAEGR